MMRLALVVASMGPCGIQAAKAPLPDVEKVLGKANTRALDFAEQAEAMRQRLHAQQDKIRAALVVKKTEYEQILAKVANHSQAISDENGLLTKGNQDLEQRNAKMTDDLNRLSERNTEMRTTLQAINHKVSAAQWFLVDSLKLTDDSHAKELQVLAPTTPKPTLDRFLAVTANDKLSLLAVDVKPSFIPEESLVESSFTDIDNDISIRPQSSLADSVKFKDDNFAQELKRLATKFAEPAPVQSFSSGRRMSLLATGSKRSDDPTELVGTLSRSLMEIATAEAEGAKELQAQFEARLEGMLQHQAELNATRTKLQQEKAALVEHRGKLIEAQTKLRATKDQLTQRLRSLRVFASAVEGSVGSSLGGGRAATFADLDAASETSSIPTTNETNATSAEANVSAVAIAAVASNASTNASTASVAHISSTTNATVAEALPLAIKDEPAAAVKKSAAPVVDASAAPAAVNATRALPAAVKTAAATPAAVNWTAPIPVKHGAGAVAAPKAAIPGAEKTPARSVKKSSTVAPKRAAPKAPSSSSALRREQRVRRVQAAPSEASPAAPGWTGWFAKLR